MQLIESQGLLLICVYTCMCMFLWQVCVYLHKCIFVDFSRSSIRYLLSPCPSLSSLHTHFSQHLHWSPLEPRGENITTSAGSVHIHVLSAYCSSYTCICLCQVLLMISSIFHHAYIINPQYVASYPGSLPLTMLVACVRLLNSQMSRGSNVACIINTHTCVCRESLGTRYSVCFPLCLTKL